MFPLQHHWRRSACISKQKIPHYLRHLLLDPGSTTKRFQELPQKITLKILKQEWGVPTHDESMALNIKKKCRVLIREVALYGDQELWMLARTVIPNATLNGRLRGLKKILDERPIGEFLFSEKSIARSEYELSVFTPAFFHSTAFEGLVNEKSIWGRRSFFFVDYKPLLLTEYFLSAIKDVAHVA